MTQAAPPPAIELLGIDKRFGAVHANRSIDLRVDQGTIHGIVGENGAGKSTLMSILYGFYSADAGEIRINGSAVAIGAPDDAISAGIGMVHQHFMLVGPFTVLENIVLGAEGGFLLAGGMARARARLIEIEKDYGLEVPLDSVVDDLTVGQQQRVEILKALFRGADILILDEPTGVLTPTEADHLFRILRMLRDQGKTVILITHKLREVLAVTDNVSVMRAGEIVETVPTKEATAELLAERMVGRRVLLRVEKPESPPGDVILDVRDLSVVDGSGVVRVADVSFEVRAGEILGIAGVAGNGQSELIEAMTGIRAPTSGSVAFKGRDLGVMSDDANALRRSGIAHVPEDRQRMGLVTSFQARENTILGYQGDLAYRRNGLMDWGAVTSDTQSRMEKYDIRPRQPLLRTAHFSGGNQQKIVIAREIEHDPDLLVVGQPTRGVDIGAIEFIHRRLVEMRNAGKAIILVSVELDEIRSLADRILVMFAGRIIGERPAGTGENELGLLMAGISDDRAA